MTDKQYVCDTNILLNNTNLPNDYRIVILSHVLRELEKHKVSHNRELAYKARRAVRFINNNKEQFIFDTKNYNGSELGNDYTNEYQDDNILKACVDNNYGLITADLLLKMKAKGLGIEVVDLKEDEYIDEFKGYKTVCLDDIELAHFYENMNQNLFDLYINQYLIIKNTKQETIDKYRWDGLKHVKLSLPPKRYIKAKNDLQECALDLLYSKDIPVKFIAGKAGSGKTFLTTKMALFHLKEKGNYAKIMMVRNPVGSGEEIGFLQGDKNKKTEGFFKSIVQHLEQGEIEATAMEQREELVREIPFYMKGLSVSDTFIIADEAEDMNPKLIKLLGTRLAENSSITFVGDWEQAEDKYVDDNGLRLAIDYFKDKPLVGTIVLNEDERSDASKLFSEWNI